MPRPSVVILATDPTLLQGATSALAGTDWRVATEPAEDPERAHLIVRDWRDPRRLDDPGVPVLTLDLAITTGWDLVRVVSRVLGPRPTSSFTAFATLRMVMRGRIPRA